MGQNFYMFNGMLGGKFESAQLMESFLGNVQFGVAARAAYKLDLTGPTLTVNAGCATALFALHQACRALLFDECRMALAGAVSLNLNDHWGYHYIDGGYLSPSGHLYSFEARSQGIVFGSGVGVAALKRLENALADGDTIYAVIKGSATLNDGSNKAAFIAPTVDGQSRTVLEAAARAGVELDSISYVETHGTGTPLGDPVEIAGLTKAFRVGTARKGFCRLGSVKGNIGHADAAAGMSELFKVIMAMQRRQIPKTLNFETPSPNIDFANSPFVVNTALTPWEDVPLPRRAGVNSLGFGGHNAHLILEEAPTTTPGSASRPAHLVVLSAKTASALETQTRQLADYLKLHPDLALADVAYTLQLGRRAFLHRRMVAAQTLSEAVQQLEAAAPAQSAATVTVSEPGVVWMFPGLESQYVGMGRELYDAEPVFRAAVDQCAELLKPHLDGADLRAVLYPEPAQSETAAAQLAQTRFTPPALFVIEYALAQMWQQWGIRPQALIGRSLGEYAAACLAGVFSLADALALVAARDRLMQAQPAGDIEPFAALVAGVTRRAPQIPFISNVTGTWITDEQATSPDYWATQARQAVHFSEGAQQLLADSFRVFLEVGPGNTLCTLLKQQTPAPALAVASMRHPQQAQPDMAALLNAMGQLWLNGVAVHWETLYAEEQRRRVALPTYPFERQRCWVGSPPGILTLQLLAGELSQVVGASAEMTGVASPATSAPTIASDPDLTRLWVSRPRPNPSARRKLFCFPYAGGGAAVFYRWPEQLPVDVEVCAIRAPGRESRSQEPPLTDFARFIQTLAAAIRPLLDCPFAFFGHSLGALVAFELTRQLRREGAPLPERLLVSAYRAPHLPGRQAPIHALSPDEFLQGVQKFGGMPPAVMENAELLEALLPVLRADFALAETYDYTVEPPLPCPISVFNGRDDSYIAQEELAAWNAQTQAAITFHTFPGDHFYLNDARSELLAAIVRDYEKEGVGADGILSAPTP